MTDVPGGQCALDLDHFVGVGQPAARASGLRAAAGVGTLGGTGGAGRDESAGGSVDDFSVDLAEGAADSVALLASRESSATAARTSCSGFARPRFVDK